MENIFSFHFYIRKCMGMGMMMEHVIIRIACWPWSKNLTPMTQSIKRVTILENSRITILLPVLPHRILRFLLLFCLPAE